MSVTHVHDSDGIRKAMDPPENALLLLDPGMYKGNLGFKNARNVQWVAVDRARPPVFCDCAWAAKFEGGQNILLDGIHVQQWTEYGFLFRPGPTPPWTDPVRGAHLRNCQVSGGTNGTAFKLAWVDGVVLDNCVVGGLLGNGITLNGCRGGLIRNCSVQTVGKVDGAMVIKTGSADIYVQGGTFRSEGPFGVWLGGDSSEDVMRPEAEGWEVERIIVAGAHADCVDTGFMFREARDCDLRDCTYSDRIKREWSGSHSDGIRALRPSSVRVTPAGG